MKTNTPTLNIPTEAWQLPTDNKQNGFSNYATWRVYQSIAEEDAIYWHWIARAATCAIADADNCTTTSVQTHPTVALATELESAFYHSPLFKDFGVYTDLLFTAMAMGEWRDVARMLFRELIEGVLCMRGYKEAASLQDARIRVDAGAAVASTAVVEPLCPKLLVAAVIRHQWGERSAYAERHERACFLRLPIALVCRLVASVELRIETDAARIRTSITPV